MLTSKASPIAFENRSPIFIRTPWSALSEVSKESNISWLTWFTWCSCVWGEYTGGKLRSSFSLSKYAGLYNSFWLLYRSLPSWHTLKVFSQQPLGPTPVFKNNIYFLFHQVIAEDVVHHSLSQGMVSWPGQSAKWAASSSCWEHPHWQAVTKKTTQGCLPPFSTILGF